MRSSSNGLAASLVLAGILILSGCPRAPTVPEPAGPEAVPPGFPAARYEAGYAPGGRVYQVDPAKSSIEIRAYRGGRLEKLGHNHIVVSRNVQGYVYLADEVPDSRADLFFSVADLIVDDPVDRGNAGAEFATRVSADAIDGTRRNMLGERLLDAEAYPFVLIAIDGAGGGLQNPVLEVTVTLRNRSRRFRTRSAVEPETDRLTVSGSLRILHSDFGLEPYSVLGGALTVQDPIDVRYTLSATILN